MTGTNEKRLSVGLVENDAHFREQMKPAIAAAPGVAQVYQWESAEVFWRDPNGLKLDLLFLDVMLPNMSGVELARHLSQRNPEIALVMLTNLNSDEMIFEALRNGAVGYLLKSEVEDIGRVIETISRGGGIITPTIAFRVLSSFKKGASPATPQLTERERAILDHMVCGRTTARVAELLGVSRFTVQDHVKNIYKKLNVHTRAAMVKRAAELNLFS